MPTHFDILHTVTFQHAQFEVWKCSDMHVFMEAPILIDTNGFKKQLQQTPQMSPKVSSKQHNSEEFMKNVARL